MISTFLKFVLFAFFAILLFIDTTFAKNSSITMHYKFDVGPRIIAREDDRLIIKVVNHVQYNTTLHWSLVYALLFGSAHQLGLENGLGWQRRQGAKIEAPTFIFRSS
ncbi:hypothetical protein Goshw_012790 [Gossypium schwendimanii]|uniref:Plastocyanin-like domain-containing protein n=1 Tax=Gossypium schwendimanii TaxID=34291 RepID=A0A7J9MNT3_GOSSC|nr:hypothetical protein [Gossypium schwendimanii]